MTTITSRPRTLSISARPGTLSISAVRRELRSDAERRIARRRRRVQRGVIASYLHDISARHTPTAAAA